MDEDPTPHNAQAKSPVPVVAECTTHYLTGIKLWLVVVSTTLVSFLILLDMSIIATAIPHITSEFHSLTDVGWYGSAYLISNCALQPLAGKFYTQLVSKYTFLTFLTVFELGSVLCGAATTSNMLIVGRAIAGMGGSGLVIGTLTILAAVAPKHQQPALIGLTMGLSQLGVVCGPLLGGVFTQHASWRWCFYVNLPIGAVAALIIILIQIPNQNSSPANGAPMEKAMGNTQSLLQKLDLVGFVIFAGFAVMISLALEWGGSTYVWRSSTIIGLFCGAGLALVVFVLWERRVGDAMAMIPGSIAGTRQVWCSCLFMGFFSGSLFVFAYYLPIYFQAVKNTSPTMSGVYMLPGIFAQVLTTVISGFAIGRTGYYWPWALLSAVLAAIGGGLLSTVLAHTVIVRPIMYQFIAGLGRGCGMQTPLIAIQNTLPSERVALGTSLAVFAQTFGGSLFLNFANLVFNHGLKEGLPKFAPTVNAEAVISAGAASFRSVVSKQDLPEVLSAYSSAIGQTFYLAVGASVATFAFAFGMGWQKIKTKKDAQVAAEAQAQAQTRGDSHA
ncbi:Major facilitator superfamily domain, general substrate transporter [Penicillium expansum]|uniref:Major facilitator superfamily domain, general substrate transporter n=1 Tax=Penicillium expansum TaxID=27334 RepID=A0A0A2JHA7_PENEN|nr:Major facilitator superfamily domain, general substrate transporter [Penicillium expansum]KGO54792.1 Major facilitator superfamily domain, general substrate transporter [Penicillium expansum]